MGKANLKKQAAIERIASHLLANGLSETGLRRLAAVAGTSDRMLIYYFGTKDALLDVVLGGIAAGVTAQLDTLFGTELRPAEVLLAQLTEVMMDEAFAPAIQLWFELVGLAARGQEPYLSNARTFADNWVTWIGARLDDSAENDPSDLYAHLEGRLMLKMIRG